MNTMRFGTTLSPSAGHVFGNNLQQSYLLKSDCLRLILLACVGIIELGNT